MSRRYGFSKRTLQATCEKLSITYDHMPELGIHSHERRELSADKDYRNLFHKYESFLVDCCSDSIDEILDKVRQIDNVALTCYERNPHQCHRHVLAKVACRRDKLMDANGSMRKKTRKIPRNVEVMHL